MRVPMTGSKSFARLMKGGQLGYQTTCKLVYLEGTEGSKYFTRIWISEGRYKLSRGLMLLFSHGVDR